MKDLSGKKLVALFSVFAVVFTVCFTGCGGKKIKPADDKPSQIGDSDRIYIDDNGELVTDEDTEIVYGEDGSSYLVDGEGNSYVYDATSAYVIQIPTTEPVTKKSTTTTTTKTTKKTTTSEVKPSSQSAVSTARPLIDQIEDYRTSNAGKTLKGFNNAVLDDNAVIFDFGEKQFRFEMHKGKYDSGVLGCELGLYSRGSQNDSWELVDSSDRISASALLYEKGNFSTSVIELSKKKIGWNGKLISHDINDNGYIMIISVELDSETMADSFSEGLIKAGFVEDLALAGNMNGYYVDGTTVKMLWL